MGRWKDWVIWCRSGQKDEKQRHLKFEVDGKEIFSYRSKPEPAKTNAGEKTDKKVCKGQSVR